MRYKGILASSGDPTELSKTVQGLIMGASSIIIFIGFNLFGINITTQDVTDLAAGVGATAGGIAVIYGLFMKVINALGRE